MRALAPGARRSRRRRLKIGSSTAPGGVGERPALDHGHRRADPAAPAQEARAVRLVLRAPHARPLHRHHVGGPDAAPPRAMRGERVARRVSSSGTASVCTKRLEKAGCAASALRGREHDLGIGGDVDLARLAAQIDERDAADLGVVLRRDQHLEGAHDGAVAPADLGAVLEEGRLVGVGLHPRGLMARRPHRPARASRRKMNEPQASRVTSSRQRVTATRPQRL